MIFSVVGKVANTGLVEVPMGISLRKLIFDIAGGIPNGKRFKAAQIGGPSGGCIPAAHLDTPIDYESLKGLGAIVGSGGLVVADESTCMVDFARYFMTFTQEESCGKCVPCRVGTRVMLTILERICAGNGEPGDIDYLVEPGREHQTRVAVRLGADCAESGAIDDPLFPRRVRGAHYGPRVSRQSVQGADYVLGHSRKMQWLYGVLAQLSIRSDYGRKATGAFD